MAKVYPAQNFPADAVIEALDGTTHQETGVPFVPVGANQNSVPSLEVQFNRARKLLLDALAFCAEGKVEAEGGLNVGVRPLLYRSAANRFEYDGATGVAVPDDDVTFLWLDAANALQQGAALPSTATVHMPLAEVTAAAGQVTAVKDIRGWGMKWVS